MSHPAAVVTGVSRAVAGGTVPSVGSLVSVVVGLAVLTLSSSAWALCPNCLGQNRSLTPTLQLIGLFLMLPFVVAVVVAKVVARVSRRGQPAADRVAS